MNNIEIKNYELPKVEIAGYDELKKLAEQDTEKYKNYLVTEETLKDDSKKRAELRNVAKQINSRRIEIEREISKPIKKFKEECDYLKTLYEQSALLIDQQIKVFEEKQKNEKKLLCEKIYEEVISEFKDQIPFEKIFDIKWLNKSTTEEMIKKEIEAVVENTKNSLETIKSLNSEFELEIVNTYFETLDVNQAIVKNHQLLEQQEKMKEFAERQQKVKEQKVERMLKEEVMTDEIDPIKTYTLKITAPISKQKALREFLSLNEMKFEKVN